MMTIKLHITYNWISFPVNYKQKSYNAIQIPTILQLADMDVFQLIKISLQQRIQKKFWNKMLFNFF
jgi:hypothetical protein